MAGDGSHPQGMFPSMDQKLKHEKQAEESKMEKSKFEGESGVTTFFGSPLSPRNPEVVLTFSDRLPLSPIDGSLATNLSKSVNHSSESDSFEMRTDAIFSDPMYFDPFSPQCDTSSSDPMEIVVLRESSSSSGNWLNHTQNGAGEGGDILEKNYELIDERRGKLKSHTLLMSVEPDGQVTTREISVVEQSSRPWEPESGLMRARVRERVNEEENEFTLMHRRPLETLLLRARTHRI